MVSCSAVGCTNRSEIRREISFHKIPSSKHKILRQQWLHNIRRTGSIPKDTSFYICSEHFEVSRFKHDFQVCIYIYS